MRFQTLTAAFIVAASTLVACNTAQPNGLDTNPSTNPDQAVLNSLPDDVQRAYDGAREGTFVTQSRDNAFKISIAELNTRAGKTQGSIALIETLHATFIVTRLEGQTPGKHGMHFHAVGQCTDSVNAAGATVVFGGAGLHYDPEKTNNHGPATLSRFEGHAGDLGNITVNDQGNAFRILVTSKKKLVAKDLVGSAVIFHAGEDDLVSQPVGNSGARTLCGVGRGL